MQSRNVEKNLDRILTAIRNRIRERGFTQLEVQEELKWGRSYISQLLTRQKALRVEQVLQILKVIGVEPAEFWGEVFQFGETFGPGRSPVRRAAPPSLFSPSPFADGDDDASDDDASDPVASGLHDIRLLYHGIVRVLTNKGLITADALEAAV